MYGAFRLRGQAMRRRDFLRWAVGSSSATCLGAAGLGAAGLGGLGLNAAAWRVGAGRTGSPLGEAFFPPPAFSVIPVVGDGKWIWTEPPAEGTGYLEPRPYKLKIGIELESPGDADSVLATTPVPVAHPEQKIEDVHLETDGCEAELRELAPGMGQMLLSAESIAQGSVVRAIAHYTLTLFKQYHNYQRRPIPGPAKTAGRRAQGLLAGQPGHPDQHEGGALAGGRAVGGHRPSLGQSPAVCRVDSQEHPAANRQLHERHRGPRTAIGRLRGDVCRVRGPVPLDRHSGPAGLGAQSQLVGVLSDSTAKAPGIGFPPTRPATRGSAGPGPMSW